MRRSHLHLLLASLVLFGGHESAAQTVGVSAAVNKNALGTPPTQAVRTIVLGDEIIHNELIETDAIGLLQILLKDGTAFTVGPNSRLSIDRFVYDKDAGTAKVAATLTKGVFRFIGGRTSKTPGGVSLETPVGTIGIRGAVVDINLTPSTGTKGAIIAHIDMIFGDEVTLTGRDGRTQRIYEPGYSIVVGQGGSGSQATSVSKTPQTFRSEIQTSLTGAPGTSGGAPKAPTDPIVVDSRIAAENSSQPPLVNAPPIPQPRPENRADTTVRVVADAASETVRTDVVQQQTEPNSEPTSGPSPTPPPDATPEPTPEPTPTPRSVAVRLATAGATYVSNSGDVITDPGRVGLIGGSVDEDRPATLSVAGEAAIGTATTNRGDLVLPVYSDSTFTAHDLTAADGASIGGVPLTGRVYSGEGGFAAYVLAINGDATQPVYALTGTPIADVTALRTSDIRTYQFTRDPLQDLPVPFMSAGALASDYASASISDFYMLEAPTGSTSNPVLFQSWLLIEGQGPNQKTGIGVNVGPLVEDDGLAADFGRRGSFRDDPYGYSSQVSGTVVTADGPSGGNDLFGANGQYAVLAGDSSSNDFFSDADSFKSEGVAFSTVHVLSLNDERPLSQFVAEQGDTRLASSNSGALINGFAAGLLEVGRRNGNYDQVLATSGADPSVFSIQFDPDTNSIGGELEVTDQAVTKTVHIAFGNGVNGNSTDGRSVYIDDDLFAAVNNNNRNRNYLAEYDVNRVATTYRQSANNNARTYLISGDANSQSTLVPNGKLCDCDFLEWGWWGTKIRSPGTQGGGSGDDIAAGVHLGTWVAGDITTDAQALGLAGTASFNGSAIAQVMTSDSTGVADYLAGGAMSMQYDFAARTGQMAITGLDGRDFDVSLAGTGARLSGTLNQTNLAQDASGSVQGAFVNQGLSFAQGVIGNFDLSSTSTDWQAVGIFAGARP